jgi:2-haloacid dehalogenase
MRAAVFDAYGTLLDVHAAMAAHADKLPPDWERISQEWRQKQLEYTWVRSLTGPAHHRDFWRITQDALDFVAARHRITDPATRAALLESYRRLAAYPDAVPVLRRLREQGVRTAILSNGDPGMLGDAVRAAGLDALLDAVLSVEAAGVFKPDPRVYQLAVDRLGVVVGDITFVSSNAWDAYGALAFGFQVAWCNRAGSPDEYGLRGQVQEISGLDASLDAPQA